MSKDIKKALEHCVEWNCGNCPNRDELGSGEIVCRGRLLPEVLQYVSDLEAKLVEKDKEIEIVKHERDANGASYMSACKMLTKERQDKISFALEQLEKVKEKINNCPITDYDTNKHFVKMYQSDAIRQVDNQIKQLKEGK